MRKLPISNDSLHHLPDPTVETLRRDQDGLEAQRTLAEECPVALVYNGTTAAVVMATPADLKDLALGFSLTQGIIDNVSGLKSLDIIPGPSGVELRMWLAGTSEQRFRRRQRRLVGPTGCGLCGIESLADATRPAPHLTRSITIRAEQVESALLALSDAQRLNRATHAAGFFHPNQELVAVREDVGRHNALDKLAGTLASTNISAGEGAIVLTSRVSIELVQKAAAIGCPMLVAVSAPTALAVRAAEACGITLIACCAWKRIRNLQPSGCSSRIVYNDRSPQSRKASRLKRSSSNDRAARHPANEPVRARQVGKNSKAHGRMRMHHFSSHPFITGNPPRHQGQTGARPAFGLRLPDHRAEQRRGADSPEGDAADPPLKSATSGCARRGTRPRRCSVPCPTSCSRSLGDGPDKEDRSAA